MPVTKNGNFLKSLGDKRYWATRNQGEWRDYHVPDPQADALYAAAGRTLVATQPNGRPVPSISASTDNVDWLPENRKALIAPQRFHPQATMLWRNIIGQPIQNRPAANLTHFLSTPGYGGVMPVDAQPFLDKPSAWNDPTRGRP